MTESIIYAENTQNYYQIDKIYYSTHIHTVFDDYEGRHFWEKGIYYDYDLILYHNIETNKRAIIISYWDVRGKILSCPDCSMTKLWYVKEIEEDKEKYDSSTDKQADYFDELRNTLFDAERALPHKVFQIFLNELDEKLGFKLWKEEELIKL